MKVILQGIVNINRFFEKRIHSVTSNTLYKFFIGGLGVSLFSDILHNKENFNFEKYTIGDLSIHPLLLYKFIIFQSSSKFTCPVFISGQVRFLRQPILGSITTQDIANIIRFE